jgi:hypothetical protein
MSNRKDTLWIAGRSGMLRACLLYPNEHQQALRQYRAVFQQRLDGALRDAEIGFVRGVGFSATTPAASQPPKEIVSLKPRWLGMSVDLKEAARWIWKRRPWRTNSRDVT